MSILQQIYVLNKRPKLTEKVWISKPELRVFKSRLVQIFGLQAEASSFNFTLQRILDLWDKSGPQFTFYYLKEAVRLCIRSIAGSPEPVWSKGPIVSRDRNGLPHLLDTSTRLKFIEWKSNKIVVVAFLSFLSVYRVFPTRIAANLSTIVDKFTGTARSLDSDILYAAVEDLLGSRRLKLTSPKLLKMESAGPNGQKSAWGSSIDSLAFHFYPRSLLNFAVYNWKYGSRPFLFWLILLLILYWPLVLIFSLKIWPKSQSRFWEVRFTNISRGLFDLSLSSLNKVFGSKEDVFDMSLLKFSVPHRGWKFKKTYTLNSLSSGIRNWWKNLVFFSLIPTIELGKLGVVYNQAGKARIVGITNYWFQISLKPLHDQIFWLLKGLDSDGTFDQTRKLFELTKSGKKFHCFDLSAATDRLPIDIQADVLNILCRGLGSAWRNLLDISWRYKGSLYKYEVGQPMGAYSSWAMLALTHHVIVRVAALKVGLRRFSDYAVLGDDIIICNDDVAREYLTLMSTLGVGINLSKSVISNDIAEFAKRWVGPEIDLTPIGPGLILRYIRSPIYFGAVANELVRLRIVDNFPKLLEVIKICPIKDISLTLWSTIGLGSWWVKMYGDVERTIPYALSSTNDPALFRYSLYEALSQLRLDEYRDSKLKLQKEMDYFYLNWWRIFSSKSWPLRFLEFSMKLVGPGFWCYGLSFERAKDQMETFPKPGDGSWDCIRDLASSIPCFDVSSIDWTQKRKIDKAKANVHKLNLVFERAREESACMFESSYGGY